MAKIPSLKIIPIKLKTSDSRSSWVVLSDDCSYIIEVFNDGSICLNYKMDIDTPTVCIPLSKTLAKKLGEFTDESGN